MASCLTVHHGSGCKSLGVIWCCRVLTIPSLRKHTCHPGVILAKEVENLATGSDEVAYTTHDLKTTAARLARITPQQLSSVAHLLRGQQLPSPGHIVIVQGRDRRLAVINGQIIPGAIIQVMQQLIER